MIVVLSGPGGVGKGTIVTRLLELDERLWRSRSWTTRGRRPGEAVDAYTFVDDAAFEARVAADGFVEWTEFAGNGHLYGTPTLDPPDGQDALLEIELDGAQQVKVRYPDAVLMLVVAPTPEDQEARLRGRGDDEGSVARRLAIARHEVDAGRAVADHVIVNDDVDRASNEVLAILDGYRREPGRHAAGRPPVAGRSSVVGRPPGRRPGPSTRRPPQGPKESPT